MKNNLAYVPIENDAYKQFGKESKDKIIKLIEQKNIKLVTSFDYSIKKQASYQQIEIYGHHKEVHHSIIIPKFTDDSEVQQAITLAHELGHYYILNESSPFKKELYSVDSFVTTYFSELAAWKKAKEILEQSEIIDKNGNEWQQKALEEFINMKNESLKTYRKPITKIFNEVQKILSILIFSYLLVALMFVLQNNNIPVPFPYELQLEHFYSYVTSIFVLGISVLFFKWFVKWTVKTVLKTKK